MHRYSDKDDEGVSADESLDSEMEEEAQARLTYQVLSDRVCTN